ncbi:hypothetical protein POM88_027170 [Heracleum sosnowskyi]|uniref:Uncharacterized protein n=1 Tax=Heracleum sosnowskyi TaxID=360622 RepID=A0AAD8I8F9_9APIA|nr:hypothetical protein POM88_027170 [Heracleum sosnowskyi]
MCRVDTWEGFCGSIDEEPPVKGGIRDGPVTCDELRSPISRMLISRKSLAMRLHPDSGPDYSHSRTPPPTIHLGRGSSSESDPSEDPTSRTPVHSSIPVREPPPPGAWPVWPTPTTPTTPTAPTVSHHTPTGGPLSDSVPTSPPASSPGHSAASAPSTFAPPEGGEDLGERTSGGVNWHVV